MYSILCCSESVDQIALGENLIQINCYVVFQGNLFVQDPQSSLSLCVLVKAVCPCHCLDDFLVLYFIFTVIIVGKTSHIFISVCACENYYGSSQRLTLQSMISDSCYLVHFTFHRLMILT